MKKIIKYLLCLLVMFIFMSNVMAIDITTNSTTGTTDPNSKLVTNTGNLTIKGVNSGDRLSAYKIIDVFYNENNNTLTYEFTSNFKNFLDSNSTYRTLTVEQYTSLTSGNITNGSTVTTSTLDTLVSSYASYIKTNNIAGTEMTLSGTNVSSTLPAGSYLVLPTITNKVYAVMVGNISLGADDNSWKIEGQEIVAKVSDASINKVVKSTSSNTGTFTVGDEYSYVITTTLPTFPTNATNKSLVLRDVLGNNIVFDNSSLVIKNGDTTLTIDNEGKVLDANNHVVATITYSNGTFTMNINADYLDSNNMTVEYKARLGSSATLGSSGNTSRTTLTYSNDPYGTGTKTTDEIVDTVYTYGIKLFKHDGNNNGLEGSIYKVYSDSNLTNEVATITTASDGYGESIGLASGTYYLKETKSPNGYKLNNDAIPVTIDTTKDYTNVSVADSKMGLLPSTGGMGTYIFIILGAVIIILAILFLYKKKKDEKNK